MAPGQSPYHRPHEPERGCTGLRTRHQGDIDRAMCPPTPKPGLPGSPARPSQATDQGARLVSAWGPGAPPPPPIGKPASVRPGAQPSSAHRDLIVHTPQTHLEDERKRRPQRPHLWAALSCWRRGTGAGSGPSGSRCGEAQVPAHGAFVGVIATGGQGPGSLLFWGLCLPTRPQPVLLPQGPGGGH